MAGRQIMVTPDMMDQPKPAPAMPDNVAKVIRIGGDGPQAPEQLSVSDIPFVEARNPGEEQPYPNQGPEVPTTPDNSAQVQQPPDEIEDPRFKGKGKKDIYDAYKNLESEVGRHRNEVGEMRKFVDSLLLRQNQTNQPPQPAPQPQRSPEDDAKILNQFFEKPQEFIQSIEDRALNKIQGLLSQVTVQQVREQNADVYTDPQFRQWASSVFPPNILQQADADPRTLMGLINAYKRPGIAPTQSQPVSEPVTAPPNVRVVPVGNASGPAPTKNNNGSKPFYSRAALMKQFIEDPVTYRRMEGEYNLAYQEGRVKP